MNMNHDMHTMAWFRPLVIDSPSLAENHLRIPNSIFQYQSFLFVVLDSTLPNMPSISDLFVQLLLRLPSRHFPPEPGYEQEINRLPLWRSHCLILCLFQNAYQPIELLPPMELFCLVC